MPGWDLLQTVTALHGAFQLVGLILLVIMAGLVGFIGYQLRRGVWPEWLDIGAYQLRSRFFEIGCAGGAGAADREPSSWPTVMAFARDIDGRGRAGQRRPDQAPDG